MHAMKIEEMAEALRSVAKAAEAPATGTHFGLRMHDGIAYTLPAEAAETYSDQVRHLLKHADFEKRFSEEYLRKKLNAVLAALIQDTSTDASAAIHDMVASCQAFHTKMSVYVRLEGVRFNLAQSWRLGAVTLHHGNESFLAALDARRDVVVAEVRATEANKAAAAQLIGDAFRQALKDGCVLEFVVDAEPDRAFERARDECRLVVDFLRMVSKFLYPLQEDIRIGLLGERPSLQTYAFVISEDTLRPTPHRTGSPLPFELSKNVVNKMTDLGLVALADALASPDASKVDLLLRRSIHWLSVALVQDEAETCLGFLIIALECFFKPEAGSSITGTVAEGAAFALGKDAKGRKAIASHVRGFYQKRSTLTHGGIVEVSLSDKLMLMQIVIGVICVVLGKRRELRTLHDITAWLDSIKYG